MENGKWPAIAKLLLGHLALLATASLGLSHPAVRSHLAFIKVAQPGTLLTPAAPAARRMAANALQEINPVPVIVVSAASFEAASIAPDTRAAALGTRLATQPLEASEGEMLPTELGGTTVEVNGRRAGLLSVSSGQINFVVPSETEVGQATVVVRAGDGTVSRGTTQVRPVAPSIFSANGDGQGVPQGHLIRVKANGEQREEPIAQLNSTTGRFTTKPIDLGPDGETVVLVLSLTGLRHAPDVDGNNANGVAESVRLVIGGNEITPLFAGSQPGLAGRDQLRAELPRSLSGRGLVNTAITGDGFGSNLVELEFTAPPSNDPPRVLSSSPGSALAGEVLALNGSGFTAKVEENQVRFSGLEAKVVEALATQLSVVVPFGAQSGQLSVRTAQGEGLSADPISVRTSISGVVETTDRKPLKGTVLRLLRTQVTATAAADGSFVLPDVPPGPAVVEVDGTTVSADPPFPKVQLKMLASASRDNQFMRPVALQQPTGPSIPVGGTGGSFNEPSQTQALNVEQATGSKVEIGGVIFEVPGDVRARFPDGSTTGVLTLSVLTNSRTPVSLPTGLFSSTIAQITPFGTSLSPGGKLTFPNTDGLPAGAQVKLFHLDQAAESQNLGNFVEVGNAKVSADGKQVETADGAITETGYFFVSLPKPTTTIIGHVVECGTKPVSGAVARARGQEAFTDSAGSFILRFVPVTAGETISVEASILHPGGQIDLVRSPEIQAVVGGVTNIEADLNLPSSACKPKLNSRPVANPTSVTTTENTAIEVRLSGNDPRGNPLSYVIVADPQHGRLTGAAPHLVYTPEAKYLGVDSFFFKVKSQVGESNTASVTILIKPAKQPPSLVVPSIQTITLGQSVDFAVGADIGESATAALQARAATPSEAPPAFIFSASNLPPKAALNQTSPTGAQFHWTPGAAGYYLVTFKVADGSSSELSDTRTVAINVTNPNRQPTLTAPGSQTAIVGQLVSFTVSATNPDAGQMLSFTAANLPPGASFFQTQSAGAQFGWSATTAGTYQVSLTVTNNRVVVMFTLNNLT